MEDRLLLQRFVRDNSQEAFAALTARYVSLVYAVCRRELEDADAAEDVTQAVFLILARKAPHLARNIVLSGWLFQTARYAAKNARLTAQRRAAYEQKAAEALMEQQTETERLAEDEHWAEIEPLLNQSLAALKAGERECVLLRFFQGANFAEVGASLGLSEDAARKRVTRSLEKMRQFFTKNGVIIPAIALPVLITAHAAKAAPIGLAPAIAQSTAGVLAGHINVGLTSPHVYKLSEGILKAMKLVQLKVAVSVTAALIIGAISYTLASDASAKSSQPTISLDDAINVTKTGFSKTGEKDAVRNVILAGKVRYEDGKPAGGVEVGAQMQQKAIQTQTEAILKSQGPPVNGTVTVHFTKSQQEESWNNATSKPDGSYQLPVAAGVPYNVMVFDTTGKWVAAAVEGASGTQNSTLQLPDLILTRGSLVVGKVTTGFGLPVPHTIVGGYGANRPETTAAANSASTDLLGNYRLRVAPGQIRVYVGLGSGEGKVVQISPGQIVTADLQIKP